MTIKGTLETFNLRELLQMLAFNQKVGTLVLETERGPQTVYVDRGRVAFVAGDTEADHALLRVLYRQGIIAPDRLERALQINRTSGRHLGTVLGELGACDAEDLALARLAAAEERFLDLQLTSVSRFEFLDGQAVAPNGEEADPIEPALVVDSLLLDLTRKMDQWAELSRVVPGMAEVYETTGVTVELSQLLDGREVEPAPADRVIAAFDGFRTLNHIVEVSFADPLTVLEVTAAMVEAGAVRPVPVEDLLARADDLLARGDAQPSLPLYRRAIEREGAPPEARLRLADALEATGEREAAALELETYAALQDGAAPKTVFDALLRALQLKDSELSAAARVCDYYLRNRPWLDDRQDGAVRALRSLIHGAVTSRRPLEAAERLGQFVANGDAPGEDLLVLADLYASGGERTQAASALYRRAEDLLTHGRTQAGRELLERTLQLDPSRTDARGRLHMLLGANRRKRQRRRILVFLVLLAFLLLGAGAAWWAYNQEANRAVRAVRETAERAVNDAEDRAYELLDGFVERLTRAAEADKPDPGLHSAAEGMLSEVRVVLSRADTALFAFANELERYQATDPQDTFTLILKQLNSQRETALRRAEDAVENARQRGRAALASGEEAHQAGRFKEAAAQLRTARNLAFDNTALASRASVLLSHVTRYVQDFDKAWHAFETAHSPTEKFRRGVDLFVECLDSDLTRQAKLSIGVTSEPAGAGLRLGGRPLDLVTPCRVEYSPFEESDLEVRMPGRIPQHHSLPSFDEIVENPAKWRAWQPEVSVRLESGPCWTIPATEGPFSRLWASSGVPVLATADGQALQTVDVDKGKPGVRLQVSRPNPVRQGGSFPGGIDWRIVGNHTLVVRPPDGEAWETQVLGHLERAPVLDRGILVVLDEAGTVYGLDVRTGKERWRQALKSPPCHAPYKSALGVLVSTYTAGVFALDPGTGRRTGLALDARGLTLALPLGDEVVILGGSGGRIRRVSKDGTAPPTGAAHPIDRRTPWVSMDGVAWIERDGIRWLPTLAERPILVGGLGIDVQSVVGDGSVLYAVGTDGIVRAIDLGSPDTPLWQAHVGSEVASPPIPLGDLLLVLVDGGLSALAR